MKRNYGFATPLLVAAALTVGLAAGVESIADDHRRGERRMHHAAGGFEGMRGDPARLVKRITSRLDLDDAQETSINNILEAARPEFEALREKGMANRDAMWELDPASPDYSARLNTLALESGQLVTEAANLLGRVRGEVHAVLTPEQIAEMQAAADNWRERRAERRQRFQQ